MSKWLEKTHKETETFRIPDDFFGRFKLNQYYTVKWLLPFVIAHYVANEDIKTKKHIKRSCHKPKIYDYLEDKILELNKDLTDSGKKMRWCQNTIVIPTRMAFFFSVFPTINTATASGRTGTIYIDTSYGVLNP